MVLLLLPLQQLLLQQVLLPWHLLSAAHLARA